MRDWTKGIQALHHPAKSFKNENQPKRSHQDQAPILASHTIKVAGSVGCAHDFAEKD
jgi:hypothetical protein